MSLELDKRHIMVSVVVAALAFVSGKYLADMAIASPDVSSSAGSKTEGEPAGTVDLSETQLQAIKIEAVGTYHFRVEKRAVGSIAYHEQDASSSALPWHTVGAVAPDSTAKSLTKLLVANIQESDSPLIRVGQPVEAKAEAYPDRTFDGKVSASGHTVYDSGGNPAIDPNTHRITVHCDIADPQNELYPGMLADVAIQVQEPVESIAIPANGVVRKGDGTMTAWVTTDKQRFERTVKVGLQQDGYDQITDGLKPGELVVTDGAVFISNILYAPPTD